MARPTSVYIIECAGYVKIGVAYDPESRLEEINVGAPVRATLYRSREFSERLVACNIESRLHRFFAQHRSNGEWFQITPQVAWAALRDAKPLRLRDRTKRHDSVARWEPLTMDEAREMTNQLFSRTTTPHEGEQG